jgi:hypothetical protein
MQAGDEGSLTFPRLPGFRRLADPPTEAEAEQQDDIGARPLAPTDRRARLLVKAVVAPDIRAKRGRRITLGSGHDWMLSDRRATVAPWP